MNTDVSVKRDVSLDLVRLLASFLVVWVHVVLIQWFTLDVSDVSWKILNFYNMLTRACVPLFFLLSGRLFLSKKELPDIKVIFSKYIRKLVVVYLVWGLFFAADTMGVKAVLAFDIQGIWNSFLYTPKYHLWYLPSMVGVYLLLPVLWCVAKYQNGKYLGYACALFFLCTVKCSLDAMFSSYSRPNFMAYLVYELSGYSGYFLLGYYLGGKEIKIKSRYLVAGFFLVSMIGAGIGEVYSVREGAPNGLLYDYLGAAACMQAALLYCAFTKQKTRLSNRAASQIATASRCTLFIYLFHPFVLEHLNDLYELFAEVLTPMAVVPIMTLLVWVICYLIARLLLKIPIVNKWLL